MLLAAGFITDHTAADRPTDIRGGSGFSDTPISGKSAVMDGKGRWIDNVFIDVELPQLAATAPCDLRHWRPALCGLQFRYFDLAGRELQTLTLSRVN
jgi:hypothetical protein